MLMDAPAQRKQADRLVLWGLVLFLIGLVAGLLVPHTANPRMGLAAHLEGVMNGMFLMLLGLLWNRLLLSGALLKAAFILALYGTFANLLAVLLAALTGLGGMMPMAGGKAGAGVAEAVISFLLVSLALSMIALCIIMIAGYYGHMKARSSGQ